MKKIIFLTISFQLLISSLAVSQDSLSIDAIPNEVIAKTQLNRLERELELNTNQLDELYSILLNRIEQIQEKSIIKKDDARLKTINNNALSLFRKIFHSEQYSRFILLRNNLKELKRINNNNKQHKYNQNDDILLNF